MTIFIINGFNNRAYYWLWSLLNNSINDFNTGAYYKLWNLVNNSSLLAIGVKPDELHSLRMVHMYINMSELCVKQSYVTNNVCLVGIINWIHGYSTVLLKSIQFNLRLRWKPIKINSGEQSLDINIKLRETWITELCCTYHTVIYTIYT